MTRDPRRERRTALGLCLIGGVVAVVAAGRPWVRLGTAAGSPLHYSGNALQPGLSLLAIVGLVGIVAVVATKRIGRFLVGLLLLAMGAAIVSVSARVLTKPADTAFRATEAKKRQLVKLGDVDTSSWIYVGGVGGLLLAGGGMLVAVRGRNWEGLSARYESPVAGAAPGPPDDETLWDALDRGEDADEPSGPGT